MSLFMYFLRTGGSRSPCGRADEPAADVVPPDLVSSDRPDIIELSGCDMVVMSGMCRVLAVDR